MNLIKRCSIYLNFLYNKRVQRTLSGARKIDSTNRRERDVRSSAAFDFEKLYFLSIYSKVG